MKIIAIIPARFESTRLPGKILADIGGHSILYRVYQQTQLSKVFDEIIVATDHQKIVEHCNQFEMNVALTSDKHISGTDRIAEIVHNIEADIIINIQGDEPFIEIECIQQLADLMKEDHVAIGTLYKKITEKTSIFDFNAVKLVKDNNDKILYFSRQAIPCNREYPYREWSDQTDYFQHIGLYGFKKDVLLQVVKLPPSSLELSEKLEQLRWIQNGFTIYGKEVQSTSFGIDTEEDLSKARKSYK